MFRHRGDIFSGFLCFNNEWQPAIEEVLLPDRTLSDAVSWLAEKFSSLRYLVQLVRVMRLLHHPDINLFMQSVSCGGLFNRLHT
jgi:hypothetical protein